MMPHGDIGIDLYWIPLGAGGRLVRTNGKIYEWCKAHLEHRRPADLYHSALIVHGGHSRTIIENAWPIPDDRPEARGVVAEGPVFSRPLGRWRVLRYEVRRWRNGTIGDLEYAVDGPVRVSSDPAAVARLLALVPSTPRHTWGRDEIGAGEMWNSNSVISWLLARAELSPERLAPPAGGRAPGWATGIHEAKRRDPPAPRSRLARQAVTVAARIDRRLWLYVGLAYALPWTTALVVAGPILAKGLPPSIGALAVIFVAMLAGPPSAAISLTLQESGTAGVRTFLRRLRPRKTPARAWLALAIAPVATLSILAGLALTRGRAFDPVWFLPGIAFGFAAGFFEEIGWTGYAWPRLRQRTSLLVAATTLGILWGLWHAAADYSGLSVAWGRWWLPRFLALFVLATALYRVLIMWSYERTQSLPFAMAMHASYTGSLGLMVPLTLQHAEEAMFYGLFGFVLLGVVVLVATRSSTFHRAATFSRPETGPTLHVSHDLLPIAKK